MAAHPSATLPIVAGPESKSQVDPGLKDLRHGTQICGREIVNILPLCRERLQLPIQPAKLKGDPALGEMCLELFNPKRLIKRVRSRESLKPYPC